MKFFHYIVLLIACTCYASPCFFVLTTSDSEVKSYCNEEIMGEELAYSQRNVACGLQKYRD